MPLGQSTQLRLPLRAATVPLPHARGAAMPDAGHSEPASHATHDDRPSCGPYVPGLHAAQLAAPCRGAKDPRPQARHRWAVSFAGKKVPGLQATGAVLPVPAHS